MGLFLLCLDSWQNYSRYMQQLLMYCTLWLTERFVTKHATSILESTQAAWNQQVDSIVLITTISKLPRSTFLQWWFCSLQSVRSDALNSSFAMFVYSWNRVTVKFWRQYLQNLQSYLEIFIIHLAAAVTLLQTDSISSVSSLSTYFRDMTCFDGFYLKKSRCTCSVLEKNIHISFGPNGAPLGSRWRSTLRAASRSY